MAQVLSQKVKGCKKCGRNTKKAGRNGSPISLFVKGKIDGKAYFAATGQKVRQ